jgi:hypothetical protein
VDEQRRDGAIERELTRALAAASEASSGGHVDAELAAAWMERRLDHRQAQAIERHLAGCGDCQAMLATLARISPELPGAPEGFGWRTRVRAGWLLPATVAAAAALVIWVAVPQQRTAPAPVQNLQAPIERPAEAPTVTSPTAPSEAVAAPVPPAAALRDAAGGRRDVAAETAPPQRVEKAVGDAAVGGPAGSRPDRASPAAPAAAAPAPESERRDRTDTPPEFKESVRVEATAPVVDTQTATARTGESPAPAVGTAQEADRRAGNAASQRAGFGVAARLAASGDLPVAAPEGGARWRRRGTIIEFAPRGEPRFSTASLPVPADALTAGSSPGGTVCWFVGRAGLVLVTTDGTRFTRAARPADADLVAVAPADARSAVVTAADGRRFRTADAGATWTAVP